MIRLRHALAVLFLVVPAVTLHAGFSRTQDFRPATEAEKALKSVDSAPGAPAVILDWIRIDDDPQSFSAEYMRIKVLTDEGKKYGDVEVVYLPSYPFNGRVTEISARTIRPDGTIVPFDGKVYDKVVFKVGRSAVRAKTFSLADVQPGSILEYRFVRRWSQQVLFNTSWTIQHTIPMLHAKLTLRPYDSKGELASFFSYLGLPPGKMPVKHNDRYELELENMAAHQEESFAPPAEQLKAYVNFYYTSSRVQPAEFWSVESHTTSKRVEEFISRSGEAKALAAQLAGATPRETAKKIYARVQKMRNYNFEVEKSDQELKKEPIVAARNAGEVLKREAGTQEELNRAFVAIARAAGLDAAAVRVAPRDRSFFSQALPDPDQMRGEVAVVTLDGQPVYLDPGTPHAPFGTISWEKSAVPGYRVTKGAPEWLTLPPAGASTSTMKRTADLKIDGDTLAGTVVTTFSGQEALVRRLRSLNEDEEERKKAFEEEARRWFADGASVKLARLTGIDSFDEPLVAAFDVTLPNLVSSAGSRTVVPMSVFAASAKNPFAPATRTHPIYFEYPRTEDDEVKISIPDTLRVVAVPPPSDLKAGALGYRSEAKAEANSARFTRTMFVNAMLVDAKHYGPLRTFYSAALTADQKPLILVAKE